ncbi:MAG: hypothetical protein B6I38_11295 [Anaerolineaceae bacterium 4572_5.1]|nr:MAG: hypothetical protein B6I38_11295 [Anaerolineaceae bacterium 4572_5.1]
MKLFNSLGPIEIIVVILIGIIVLGPKETAQLGGKLGKLMRNVVTSDWWRGAQDTFAEIKYLPYKLMREAELEEFGKELKELGEQAQKDFNLGQQKLNEVQNQLNGAKEQIGEIQEDLSNSAWRGNFQAYIPSPPAPGTPAPGTPTPEKTPKPKT